MNFINEPWPWYVAGIGISLVMFLLLKMGKTFGISSTFRTICTICGAGNKINFFNYNWKKQQWNLWVVFGIAIGGWIAVTFLNAGNAVNINPKTVLALKALNITTNGYLPTELFSYTPKNILLLAIAGLLVGFGTRYAGGCTSGHAISGLSNLQLPSLIAVIGFFIGGLIMVWIIFPLIF